MRTLCFILLLLVLHSAQAMAGLTDGRVRSIMNNSANWHPEDYVRARDQIKKIGSPAAPELVRLLDGAKDANTISFICEFLALAPDYNSLQVVQSKFSDQDWLIRSTCGQAYAQLAVTFRDRTPDINPLWDLVTRDKDVNCIVQRNVAMDISSYDDARLAAYFKSHLFSGTVCERRTAISGLSKSAQNRKEAGDAFIKMINDSQENNDIREDAAWAISELAYEPAHDAVATLLVQEVNFGNFRSFLIRALGEVGSLQDIKLLEKVISQDPYHGSGVWTHEGREAIAKIRKRGK